jgi:hypothetical protein
MRTDEEHDMTEPDAQPAFVRYEVADCDRLAPPAGLPSPIRR